VSQKPIQKFHTIIACEGAINPAIPLFQRANFLCSLYPSLEKRGKGRFSE
jgi:hypothetical protein